MKLYRPVRVKPAGMSQNRNPFLLLLLRRIPLLQPPRLLHQVHRRPSFLPPRSFSSTTEAPATSPLCASRESSSAAYSLSPVSSSLPPRLLSSSSAENPRASPLLLREAITTCPEAPACSSASSPSSVAITPPSLAGIACSSRRRRNESDWIRETRILTRLEILTRAETRPIISFWPIKLSGPASYLFQAHFSNSAHADVDQAD